MWFDCHPIRYWNSGFSCPFFFPFFSCHRFAKRSMNFVTFKWSKRNFTWNYCVTLCDLIGQCQNDHSNQKTRRTHLYHFVPPCVTNIRDTTFFHNCLKILENMTKIANVSCYALWPCHCLPLALWNIHKREDDDRKEQNQETKKRFCLNFSRLILFITLRLWMTLIRHDNIEICTLFYYEFHSVAILFLILSLKMSSLFLENFQNLWFARFWIKNHLFPWLFP